MTSRNGDELVLRPALHARVVGWCVVGVGLVFAASGFADPNETETLLIMVLAGLVMAAVGLTIATAVARVDAAGIRYRNGLQHKSLATDGVTGVTVGPGSGAPPPRLAYVVHRVRGRSVRLDRRATLAERLNGRGDVRDRTSCGEHPGAATRLSDVGHPAVELAEFPVWTGDSRSETVGGRWLDEGYDDDPGRAGHRECGAVLRSGFTGRGRPGRGRSAGGGGDLGRAAPAGVDPRGGDLGDPWR